MQFYIEEYVEKSSEIQAMARKAYNSFLRSYSCYSHDWKHIFHIKNLHIGHVAKSFGIREAPNQIAANEFKAYKSNQEK
jgi:ATP-dependent RNA helicase DDX31/DBP7